MSSSPAPARQIRIIGIGTGSLQHLTRQAIAALREVHVFLAMDKGSDTDEILALRREICSSARPEGDYEFVVLPDPDRGPDADRDRPGYERGVRDWHARRVDLFATAIEALPAASVVGLLVWGDPAFYDSTIRIVDGLRERFEVAAQVVPGIGAVQALAASHQIVLNAIGGPIHVTTGRRLLDEYDPALGTVVVMLDAALRCSALLQRFPDLYIYWGAYLGSPDEVLVRGRLADVIDELRALRAQLRARHGWLMDTYALLPAHP